MAYFSFSGSYKGAVDSFRKRNVIYVLGCSLHIKADGSRMTKGIQHRTNTFL